MTDQTTLDDILHPGERAAAEFKQLDAQLACLDSLISTLEADRVRVRATEFHAALDDLPLTTLHEMQRALMPRVREWERTLDPTLDEYAQQMRLIDAEVLQRTARFAHRAGLAWDDTEDARLRRLSIAGETIECISSTLGRSTVAVSLRAERFGISFGDDGCAIGQPRAEHDGRPFASPRTEYQRDAAFALLLRGAK